tara:strand:+ start:207 stop:422 length:216 start_codon:yes stop_codon:yes gene_type:complete
MHLTNKEILDIVALAIYLYSMFIYLKELFADFKKNKPKVFSEYFWYVILLVGGFIPVLNTIVGYYIIKSKR